MHGALLVDKPSGPTSHDIVAIARRALKTRAIGHTGTLDPLATGLLVLLVGHATRLSQFLVTDEKEYIADVRLGIATATYDAQGLEAGDARREARGAMRDVTPEQIQAALAHFIGTFPQLPPPFSAKKVGGERAYKKARRNESVELKPVDVTVKELEMLSGPRASHLAPPALDQGLSDQGLRDQGLRDQGLSDQGLRDEGLIRLRVACSSGFYVRSLAHDIGQLLGCGAHLEALRRTRAGQFTVADALTLEAMERVGGAIHTRLVTPSALLAGMAAVTPTEEGRRRVGHGNALAPAHLEGAFPGPSGDARVRVLDPSGELLAVAERRADGLLHPLVVLR
jgi:tRNA pseudouridine55 synthase